MTRFGMTERSELCWRIEWASVLGLASRVDTEPKLQEERLFRLMAMHYVAITTGFSVPANDVCQDAIAPREMAAIPWEETRRGCPRTLDHFTKARVSALGDAC